jgi:hypothetical protein
MRTLRWLLMACVVMTAGCTTYQGGTVEEIEYDRGFGASSGRMDDFQTYPRARNTAPVIPPQ